MNREKLVIHPMDTSRSYTDENSYVSVKFQKNTGRIGRKLKPQDTDSSHLQELSLMNNTLFDTIHYDIHLDIKLEYTKCGIFQEMSLTELETLHQLCALESTQILTITSTSSTKNPLCRIFIVRKQIKFH